MRGGWTFAGRLLPSVLVGALALGACDGKEKEELNRKLNESSDKLLECHKETNDLKNQVSQLKRQLATAMSNPGKVVLNDPEIIELIASRKGPDDGGGGEGPDPKACSKIVMQGAQALQQCYERALKKNSALQYQAGVKLLLGLTIKGTGNVDGVSVTPSVDPGLTECIKTVAARWKFPTFTAKSVEIEQSVLLTPKT